MPLATQTPPQDFECSVVFNQPCGPTLKYMRLHLLRNRLTDQKQPFLSQPGQFVMLSLPESQFSFRRPFSIAQVPDAEHLDIFYKHVGRGTEMLWELKPNDKINCLGPLGNGFSLLTQDSPVLLIGGGIGIAPFYYLAHHHENNQLHCFYGARSKPDLGLLTELQNLFADHFDYATNDGSAGFHGHLGQLLEHKQELIEKASAAYICGPTRMMQAVSSYLLKTNPTLQVEVSLEEHMPCGTGACSGCVVHRTDQFLPSKTCIEGPVFPAHCIQWPISPAVAGGRAHA